MRSQHNRYSGGQTLVLLAIFHNGKGIPVGPQHDFSQNSVAGPGDASGQDAPRNIPDRGSVPVTETTTVSTRPLATHASREGEDALLADAGRIFEKLRIRLAELDHREQMLQQQNLEVTERQTRFSRWVEQTKLDLTTRETQLQKQESAAERQQQQLNEQTRRMQEERQQHERERQRFEQQRSEQEHLAREAERELEDLRRTRLREIERLEQESADSLAAKRREFEEFCRGQLDDITLQQSQATRRLKLQEDHLERLRTQVEHQRTTLQLQTQSTRQGLQQKADVQRRRAEQLRHVRQLLDQRVETSRREERIARESLEQERQTFQSRLQEFEMRRQEWLELQESQQRDLETQWLMLDRQERQLALQRENLLQLRQEIQEQHAANLELRIAIEERRIELAIENGQTPDLDGLSAIRDKLAEHFIGTRNQLEELENRLTAEGQELARRLADLKLQEEESRRRLAKEQQAFRQQRAQLDEEREQIDQAREAWAAEKYNQIAERREAERVIQTLLEQLEGLHTGHATVEQAA